jgi:hypothetical protein
MLDSSSSGSCSEEAVCARGEVGAESAGNPANKTMPMRKILNKDYPFLGPKVYWISGMILIHA